MAIKTVTQANLADHVAEKRAQGANISTQEQVAAIAVQAAAKPQEKPAEGDSKSESRIVATGEEKLEGAAPEPQGTPQPTQKQGKKNPVRTVSTNSPAKSASWKSSPKGNTPGASPLSVGFKSLKGS